MRDDELRPASTILNSVQTEAPAEQNTAGDTIAGFLNNPTNVEALVIAEENNNKLAAEGFGKDLLELSYGQLVSKYGVDVANNRSQLTEVAVRNNVQQQQNRNILEAGADAGLSAGQAFGGILSGINSAAFSASSVIADAVGAENTATGLKIIAAQTGKNQEKFSAFLEKGKTQKARNEARILGTAGFLNSQDNAAEADARVAAGENKFISGAREIGANILDNSKLILSNPTVLSDTVAQGLGSLGPSSKLVGATEQLATKAFTKLSNPKSLAVLQKLASNPKNLALVQAVGRSSGIGVTEATSVYMETVGVVNEMTHEQLLGGSDVYVELLKENSPAKAKILLADQVGRNALIRQLPAAAASGAIASKFEAAPLRFFKKGTFGSTARGIALETGEEALQGFSGALNQNIAIQQLADRDQRLTEDVGESTSTGAIAGFGIAGALASPNIAANTLKTIPGTTAKIAKGGLKAATSKPVKATAGVILKTAGVTGKVALKGAGAALSAVPTPVKDKAKSVAVSGTGKAGSILKSAGTVAGDTLDTVSSVTSKAADVVVPLAKPIVSKVKTQTDKAKAKLDPVTSKLSDVVDSISILSNKSKEKIQTDRIEQSLAAKTALEESIKVSTKDSVDIPSSVQKLAVDKSTVSVPKTFNTDVNKGDTLINDVTGILKTLSNPKTKIRKLSDDDISFAATKFTELEQNAVNLPDVVRKQVAKLISSPDIAKIRKRAASLNLNETQTKDTKVTPESIATTVNTAKINPTNVNPDFTDKILEQAKDNNLTDEDIKLISAASKTAKIVNTHRGEQIKIQTDERVALSQKPAFQGKGKDARLPKVDKLEETSHSIQVGGFTDARGKKLRSINDFAADVFKAGQNPDNDFKFANNQGETESGKDVANQFGLLVQHLTNKVGALNKSFDSNQNGKGKSFGFTSLVGGRKLVSSNAPGAAKPVAFHKNSPGSVKFAQQVLADAIAASEVLNVLVETFPELFPNGKVDIPVLRDVKSKDTTSEKIPIEKSEAQVDDTKTKTEETKVEDEIVPETPKPTYVFRPVVNAKEILDWAKSQGFPSTLTEDDLHVTMFYSKTPVSRNLPGIKPRTDNITVKGGKRKLEVFGEDSIVLTLESAELQQRFADAKADGVISDFPTFRPHITISVASDIDISKIEPFKGDIVLGKETAEDIIPDAQADIVEEVNETEDIKITQTFEEAYNEASTKEGDVNYTTGQDIYTFIDETVETSDKYLAFAKPLLTKLMKGANKRLEDVKFSTKDQTPIQDKITNKDEILNIRDFKNTALVNPATGTYDDTLLSLASVGVIDWLTSAVPPHPSFLEETLEALDIDRTNISQEDFDAFLGAVFVESSTQSITGNVLKLWKKTKNKDASMVDSRGIVEGLIKELLTVLSNDTDLIQIKSITTADALTGKPNTQEVIGIENLKKVQEGLGSTQQNVLKTALTLEGANLPNIGNKITEVPQFQNRSDIKLSKMEKLATKNMQDTPNFENKSMSSLVKELGADVLSVILGQKDLTEFTGNDILLLSVKGKNASIERNISEALAVLEGIDTDIAEDTAVFYPHGITKVGRHQMNGFNPKNNKVLRTVVSPTRSTLNMVNNTSHIESFWLAVAQNSGLNKIEKEDHLTILANIQQNFNTEYGSLVDAVVAWRGGANLDVALFSEVLGTDSNMEVIAAITAVADLNIAEEAGTVADFETSLSLELDGVVDGIANLLFNFGSGLVTQNDFNNFNRIGGFIGKSNRTLNGYYGKGAKDPYIKIAEVAESLFNEDGSDLSRAMARFVSAFGDFEIDPNTGQLMMFRDNAKNPATQVTYSAGVKSISKGIADNAVLEFYRQLSEIPNDVDLETHFKYPGMNDDIAFLFGSSLPSVLDISTFQFSGHNSRDDGTKPSTLQMDVFRRNLQSTVGKALTTAAKEVIGEKVFAVNDTLILISQIQNKFVEKEFKTRLDALVVKEKAAGNIKSLRDVTQKQYDAIISDLSAFLPTYNNGNQTIVIGNFLNTTQNKVEMSSNMEGNLRQKSLMLTPGKTGVSIIANMSQGRGDAMMMNRFYGTEDAPTDTLSVFDGIEVPIDKFNEYADRANKAVLANWDQDVLGDVLNNYQDFLTLVGGSEVSELTEIFNELETELFEGQELSAHNAEDLLFQIKEHRLQNKARKQVFKEIPFSVDHMAGSNTSFTRNVNDSPDIDLAGINKLVQSKIIELRKEEKEEKTKTKPISPLQDVDRGDYTELSVSTGDAMIIALARETKGKAIKDTVKIIRDKLPKDLKLVTGSLEQLNDYRAENYVYDGLVMTEAGQYDTVNNVLFIASRNLDTIVHELVHTATFDQVHSHYKGEKINPAVERLESLMGEFMGMDFSKSSDVVQRAVRDARKSILKRQALNDNFSKAAALNEFMAWTLSNEQLASELKTKETSALKSFSKKVILLMKRLMGGISNDVFSHIVFNTQLLKPTTTIDDNGAVDEGSTANENDNSTNDAGGNDVNENNRINSNNGNNDGGDSGGDGGNVTPPFQENTNYWIELLRNKLKTIILSDKPSDIRKLDRYKFQAFEVIKDLEQGGFVMSKYQKDTFAAIHMVLATELTLDTQSALAMGKLFEHIVDNLHPDMFSGVDKQHQFSAVMETLGGTKNQEGISDALATLLALSQTSQEFRNALDQIPTPDKADLSFGTLNEFLAKYANVLMRKVVGTVDTAQDPLGVLDSLSENLVRIDDQSEFKGLKTIGEVLDKTDALISSVGSAVSNKALLLAEETKTSDRSRLTKFITDGLAIATSVLDTDNARIAAVGAKNIVTASSSTGLGVPIAIQEFVTNLVGLDGTNEKVMSLLSETNQNMASIRRAYKEEVPRFFEDLFENKPTQEQWKALHNVLGKGDYAAVFDVNRIQDSIRLLTEDVFLNGRIKKNEGLIDNLPGMTKTRAKTVKEKAKQLAGYMNNEGGGHQLWRNAFAINKLSGNTELAGLTEEVDKLVSLYAIRDGNIEQKTLVREMLLNNSTADTDAIQGLILYNKNLNTIEDAKIISDEARINGYKGFIPDQGKANKRIVIEDDAREAELLALGYTRIGHYSPDAGVSTRSFGYYSTSTPQQGAYTKGVLQTIQSTYRGVDATSGLTVSGKTSGIIAGSSVRFITDNLNKNPVLSDNKNTLLPVYDEDGAVLYYEKSIDPDILEEFTEPTSNMALMLGSWAGRQVEESLAQEYNDALIDELKDIYDKRDKSVTSNFVNIADPKIKDQIHKDSWETIPTATKAVIADKFGKDEFWVRKDLVNASIGYREATIADVWTGKTRLPKPLTNTIRAASTVIFGDNAIKVLTAVEGGIQSTISTAKDFVIVRSMIVPYMNTQANVFQLNTRGVGLKDVKNGYLDKFSEIETYNENRRKVIRLEAQAQLSFQDANRVSVLKRQVQQIEDENQRMTISPMIEAGFYTNISEGMTELDLELTSGNFGQWFESKTDKLPKGLKTAAKFALLSKDTEIYKMADKAVQYGDFIAKSVYFDHLVNRKGISPEEALKSVSEEFVNFSVPPGRTQSSLEALGVFWFLTFKIKITKIALKIMRENPARALITASTVGSLGSPVHDNLANVLAEGRLPNATGWDQVFKSFELNPWLQIHNLNE